jgi:hypothetical protein
VTARGYRPGRRQWTMPRRARIAAGGRRRSFSSPAPCIFHPWLSIQSKQGTVRATPPAVARHGGRLGRHDGGGADGADGRRSGPAPGRLSALSVLIANRFCVALLYGAARALNCPFRRFPARAEDGFETVTRKGRPNAFQFNPDDPGLIDPGDI